MFIHKKYSFLLLLACLTANVLLAQPGKKPPKDLEGENVEIIKDFDARLLDATKVDVIPLLPALDTSSKRLQYDVPPKGLKITYAAPRLRPVALKSEPLPPGYKGYLKVGAGIPTSIYGEAGYAVSKDKTSFTGWLRHHSANSKAVENQRFMNNDLLLSLATQVAANTSVEVKTGYSMDDFYYFGYDHDSLAFDKGISKQRFKTFDLGARLFNSEKTSTDLNYFAEPKMYFLRDNFASKETGFSFLLGATKWFSEKYPLRLAIRPDFTTFNDTSKQTLNNIYIQPSFTFSADFIRLKVGGNFVSHKDLFHIYPDIDLTLRVAGDGLVIFGGWTGDLRKNTFRSLTEYNPFLGTTPNENSRIVLKNTDFQQYFGGVKGNLGFIEYSAQVGFGKAKDLALFQNDFGKSGLNGPWRRFNVLYDTAKIFNFQGNARLRIADNLHITGSFSQNIFDMSQENHAWGLPRTEGNFGAELKVLDKDKLTVRGNLFIADQAWYLDEIGTAKRTNALLDFSFGGHYQVAENIGVFLDLNNLLNNKYQRWNNYPTYGLNILGGITARF